MLSRLKRWWRNLFARHNRLWATQVVSSVAAVLLALAASWGAYFVAEGTFPDIERETLDDLLTVIASSMLAVTTFSLSIMVGAFGAAAGSATPRATPLLMADDGTRTAIAAFLSAFIYAVVAKIALGIGYYGTNGRFILFLGTLADVAGGPGRNLPHPQGRCGARGRYGSAVDRSRATRRIALRPYAVG